ncbi:MAG: rhomboid family intramembrane serine protease [Planctomycetales bacterium]|nr:rhomboid family intramembrane serine protease [Planctomycetales bacterium]
MGYSDRDYYREDATGDSMGIPGQSMVVRLIVVNVVVFLADWITASGGKHWLFDALAVHGNTVANPLHWYQFLTAGFMHSHQGLWHILGNMFAVYVFGKPLEDRLGGKEMLRLYLFAIVLGNLVWGLRQYITFILSGPVANVTFATTFGASAGVTTLTLLFCLYYPRATINLFFVIPTPAWIVGILIIVGDLSGVMSQDPKAPWYQAGLDNYAVGCLFTLAYWYFGWNFGRLPGLRGLAKIWSGLTSILSPRPNIRMHEPERDYEDLEEEADRLLAKVGEQGESSLTAKERKVLEEYSRWMRQKHR